MHNLQIRNSYKLLKMSCCARLCKFIMYIFLVYILYYYPAFDPWKQFSFTSYCFSTKWVRDKSRFGTSGGRTERKWRWITFDFLWRTRTSPCVGTYKGFPGIYINEYHTHHNRRTDGMLSIYYCRFLNQQAAGIFGYRN